MTPALMSTPTTTFLLRAPLRKHGECYIEKKTLLILKDMTNRNKQNSCIFNTENTTPLVDALVSSLIFWGVEMTFNG